MWDREEASQVEGCKSRSTVVFCGELLKEPAGGPRPPSTGKEAGWGKPGGKGPG